MLTGTYLIAATLLVSGTAHHPSDRTVLPQPAEQRGGERVAARVAAAKTADQNRGRAGRGRGNPRDGGDAREDGRQGDPGPQRRGPADPGDRRRRPNPPATQVEPPDSRRAPPPSAGERRGENDRDRGRRVYVGPRVYAPRYYVYGYGGVTPRYYYDDRYPWYPPAYYGGAYSSGYRAEYFDIGEIRLDVSPAFADVFVDGYYAGRVDDFDGVFQSMQLESGPHHIQVVAPGYVPLDFDVRIAPARKIIYRGDLIPARP